MSGGEDGDRAALDALDRLRRLDARMEEVSLDIAEMEWRLGQVGGGVERLVADLGACLERLDAQVAAMEASLGAGGGARGEDAPGGGAPGAHGRGGAR